jgi:hypothetical protein
MLPTSVAGGEYADGSSFLIAGSCAPGSVMLDGFLALIAPCGGLSGLPNEAAAAAVADIATPAEAVTRTSRRDNIFFSHLRLTGPGVVLFMFRRVSDSGA